MESPDELVELATRLVDSARARGATVAEAKARSGWELTTRVRLGKPELVQEAGHHSVALRVFVGQRVATTATSDLSEAGIDRCVLDALALADLSQEDPYAGPAKPELLCQAPFADLDLYDPTIADMDAAKGVELATEAEAAALEFDPRIELSEGATFSRVSGHAALVISTGFSGTTRGSYASLSVAPVAKDKDDKKRRGSHWTARRHREDLLSPQAVGQEAARRTLRQLGARKVDTCEAPIVFSRDTSRSVLGLFAGCILGGAHWRKSSYLLGREGTPVASEIVHIEDDPLIARAPGSRAFDGEGLASRKNVVVENGVLKTLLLDSYSARKLNRESTGSGGRSGASVSPSTSNFVLRPGTMTEAELLGSTPRGLYVTEMMGFGFNGITGDFSRGASGFWIEDGKLAFPVAEITISGNLDRMLGGIDAIGSDLDLETSIAAPCLRVNSMTISGN